MDKGSGDRRPPISMIEDQEEVELEEFQHTAPCTNRKVTQVLATWSSGWAVGLPTTAGSLSVDSIKGLLKRCQSIEGVASVQVQSHDYDTGLAPSVQQSPPATSNGRGRGRGTTEELQYLGRCNHPCIWVYALLQGHAACSELFDGIGLGGLELASDPARSRCCLYILPCTHVDLLSYCSSKGLLMPCQPVKNSIEGS